MKKILAGFEGTDRWVFVKVQGEWFRVKVQKVNSSVTKDGLIDEFRTLVHLQGESFEDDEIGGNFVVRLSSIVAVCSDGAKRKETSDDADTKEVSG